MGAGCEEKGTLVDYVVRTSESELRENIDNMKPYIKGLLHRADVEFFVKLICEQVETGQSTTSKSREFFSPKVARK